MIVRWSNVVIMVEQSSILYGDLKLWKKYIKFALKTGQFSKNGSGHILQRKISSYDRAFCCNVIPVKLPKLSRTN